VLKTITTDPSRSYKWPDTRFTKGGVLNVVNAILGMEGNSFQRLHSPSPDCNQKFAPLLRNRMGMMNVHSGCVYFGITYDDLGETRAFDNLDKCYTCDDVHVNICINCEKSMRCVNGNCCQRRNIAICGGSRPGGRSCVKFQCEECKDRDDIERGEKVIECNQVEGPEGRHHLCLGCMQRRCRMHVDENYWQMQAQAGVDPGPDCRHCTAYVLRDMFIQVNAARDQINAVRD